MKKIENHHISLIFSLLNFSSLGHIQRFLHLYARKHISEGVDTDTLESITANCKGLNCENIFIDKSSLVEQYPKYI